MFPIKSSCYLNDFLDTRAAPAVLPFFTGKKVAKELTESWGMLTAAGYFFAELNNKLIIIVGDGVLPRTGVMFAFYTKAEVVSIDPALNTEKLKTLPKVDRLTCYKSRLEDIEIDCNGKPILVIWPHSHANMDRARFKNYSSRGDIALPCCVAVPARWMRKVHFCYEDKAIKTQKNTVHVWGSDLDKHILATS